MWLSLTPQSCALIQGLCYQGKGGVLPGQRGPKSPSSWLSSLTHLWDVVNNILNVVGILNSTAVLRNNPDVFNNSNI